MEEEIKNEEQPNIEPSVEENVTGSSSEQAEVADKGEVKAERGVPIGKFKNAEELLKAYNNLEAEFTKKSQKLSSLMKDKMEEKPDDAFKTFLSKNQEAACYAEELQNRIGEQDNVDEAAYQRAWEGLLYEKLTSNNRASEPFVKNLVKDDSIQQMVIKDYLKALAAKQAPVVMASQNGEHITKNVQEKPDTFDAAKKVVMQMLS